MNKFKDNSENILYYFFLNIAKHYGIVDIRNGTFRPNYDKNPLYISSKSILEDRINRGWTSTEIAERLMDAKKLGVQTSSLSEIIPFNSPVNKESQNLMNKEEKYYHPELKIIEYPIYDEEGSLINPGHINRKEVFTFSDLINYYIGQLNPPNISRKEIGSILRHIYNSGVKLDNILRAIELWRDQSTEVTRGNDPWMLSKEYIPQAIQERIGLERFDDE